MLPQVNATTKPKMRQRTWLTMVIFLLAAALLYWATLDTGLTPGDLEGGDLITHQYAQVQARPSNAPGYPLYTMGGWLWFHGWRLLFPHANPVPILSSYSTLWAVLALALFFMLIYRITAGNLLISLGFSSFYGVTYFFWFYAVSTEQYTSAVLQTLLIVAVVLAWDKDERDGWLYALALLLGLSLAHMITVLFIAPGALAFLLIKQPRLLNRWRLILGGFLLSLLPLISYAYVYVRGAKHPEWWGSGQWASAGAWFLSFIATKQGQDELTWSLLPLHLGQFSLAWIEITPLLLLLGLVGWRLWGGRHLVLFGSTAIIYLLFCYVDRFGNWFQVIMPLYPLFLLGAAFAWQKLWQMHTQKIWRGVLLGILLALIIGKAATTYPRANQRHRPDDTGLLPGQIILAQAPPAHAAIIADVQEMRALDYLTGIWGLRPDIDTIAPQQAAQTLAHGRPLLVSARAARYAVDASGLPLRFNAWGPDLLLAQTDTLPTISTQHMTHIAADLGDGLILLGYRLTKDKMNRITLHLALKANAQPQQDWSISVRLQQGDATIMQQDHGAPGLGTTPTHHLRPGDIIFDAFALTWPDKTSQPDTLRIILYRPLSESSFQNLTDQKFSIPPDFSESQ